MQNFDLSILVSEKEILFMVIILDGNLDIGAHVRNTIYVI